MDDLLIFFVDYWKKSGIFIDFLFYRIYEFVGEKYFEFFVFFYDKYKNLSDVKGVLFDINCSWNEDFIWLMMDNSCLEVYGDVKRFVYYVYIGDIVFFFYKWCGLIVVVKVKGEVKVLDSEILY